MSWSGGLIMSSWFNITSFGSDDTGFFPLEDSNDVETSTKVILNIIDREAAILEEYGKTRVMIGGFSGGGVIAFNTLFQSKDKLAGCAGVSAYVAGKQSKM